MDTIEQAIVPITFMDDVQYTAENNKKEYIGNLNGLFINPYDMTTMYRPVTMIDADSPIADLHRESILRSRNAYLRMNTEDLVVNTIYELISDICEPHTINNSYVYKEIYELFVANFINNRYIHNTIENELANTSKYIDIILNNLYTRIIVDIIDPFIVMASSYLMKQDLYCENLYKRYMDDKDNHFKKIIDGYGNTMYCNITSIIRDMAEVKMGNMKSMFDVLKKSYINMGQFARKYYVDPETNSIISSDERYYNYLLNEKYNIEGGTNV